MLCFSSVINRMRRLTDEKRIRQASRAPVSALIRRWLAVAAGNRSGWLAVGWSGVGAMVGRWWGDGGPKSGATGTSHNKSAFARRFSGQSAIALAVQVPACLGVNTSEQYNLLILLGFPAVCWPYARRGNSPV